MSTVEIQGYDGTTAYVVELAADGAHAVYVVKARKALPRGYAYAPGGDTYRSTIKPGSATWRRQVKAAQAQLAEANG